MSAEFKVVAVPLAGGGAHRATPPTLGYDWLEFTKLLWPGHAEFMIADSVPHSDRGRRQKQPCSAGSLPQKRKESDPRHHREQTMCPRSHLLRTPDFGEKPYFVIVTSMIQHKPTLSMRRKARHQIRPLEGRAFRLRACLSIDHIEIINRDNWYTCDLHYILENYALVAAPKTVGVQ
jgi:hypothetical protein